MKDGAQAEAERLMAERATARAQRRFADADEIRSRIALLGFDVEDGPGGSTLLPRGGFDRVDLAGMPDVLGEVATLDASVHVLFEGFRTDLERFIAGVRRTSASI